MERTFDCPESGEKCNRPDCSIKYCADRKALAARENELARAPQEKEVEQPDWKTILWFNQLLRDNPLQERPRIARRRR
jgi:hypothetical protein